MNELLEVGSVEALCGLAAMCSSAAGATAVVSTAGQFNAQGCNSIAQVPSATLA